MKRTACKKLTFLVATICIILIAVVFSLLSLGFPDSQVFQTVLSIVAVFLLAILLLPFIPDWIEEIGGLGFTLKTRKGIEAVRRGQLVNKVVRVKETAQQLWIDALSVPHRLPDNEIAEFLAAQSGTASIELAELQTLQSIAPEPMPSIKSAAILSNENRDLFILYQDKLYYQHTIAYIYKLAVLKGFDFRGKQIQLGQWDIIEPLTPEMFEKYQVV